MAAMATVLVMATTVTGGLCGVVPAIVARMTLLAPGPDAGLADLGPALLSIAIGAAGALTGACLAYYLTVRALRRKGYPVNAGVSAVFLALLAVPAILILLNLLGSFAGVIVLVIAGLGGTQLFRYVRANRPR
jgi:hypothetical protein